MGEEKNNSNKSKRILVLGVHYNSSEIKSYLWNQLPSELNLADYEVVIMDLTKFEDEGFIKSLPEGNLLANANFENFLFCDKNELIVIGYPFSYSKEGKEGSFYYGFSRLFTFYPPFRDVKGDYIGNVNEEYEYWFENVEYWSRHLESNSLSIHFPVDDIPSYISDNFRNISNRPEIFITISPIAETLTAHPIAFSFTARYHFSQYVGGGIRMNQVPTARIVNLPPTTNLSIEDAIKKMLKMRFEISLETISPEWVKKYKTKLLKEIELKINDLEKNKSIIEGQIQFQQKEFTDEIKYQRLLFEQGDSLQAIVYDALELLGIQFERKDVKMDDGKIVFDKEHRGIIEIRGKKRWIERKDIRQLRDWKEEAEEEEQFPRKGIFIANCYIEKDLNERGEYFPEEIEQKSREYGLCLLKTSQIFQAICFFRENKLDIKEFWKIVFMSNGKAGVEDI